MLKVKTELHESPGRGIGLFASKPIPKNTICWQDSTKYNFDRTFSKTESEGASGIIKDFLNTYGCLMEDGSIHVCMDNARFINHSDDPNLAESDDCAGFFAYSIREIAAGEELTMDYRAICESSRKKLGFIPS